MPTPLTRFFYRLQWMAYEAGAQARGWFRPWPKLPPMAEDRTANYRELLVRIGAGDPVLPSSATGHVYLWVPGLFTEHYPGYLVQNLQRCEERGLDARVSAIDTDAGPERNAGVLRDEVLEIARANEGDPARKVVLVGHSKGGSDAVDALRLFPELVEHVHAVLAMQAPHAGTPIADLLEGGPLETHLGRFIERYLQGDSEAIFDFRTERRAQFTVENPVPEGVRVVCLATSIRGFRSGLASAATFLRARFECDSDGLVPLDSACLPGAEVVRLTNMDHAHTCFALGWFWRPSAADITEAMLALTLEMAAAERSAH